MALWWIPSFSIRSSNVPWDREWIPRENVPFGREILSPRWTHFNTAEKKPIIKLTNIAPENCSHFLENFSWNKWPKVLSKRFVLFLFFARETEERLRGVICVLCLVHSHDEVCMLLESFLRIAPKFEIRCFSIRGKIASSSLFFHFEALKLYNLMPLWNPYAQLAGHCLMRLEPNWKNFPQNSGKQVWIPEGM